MTGAGHELQAAELRLGYEGRVVVDGLDLTVPDGAITVIVGPNGCGKSTLLRGLGRLLRPEAGRVLLDGTDISTQPTRKLATRLGLLPQQPVAPEAITVADLVARGRHPHHGWLRPWSSADDEIVAEALAATSTAELAPRPVDSLSGGQRQRVWIAMALAQQTDILLLDEPTTFLDVAHQIEVLDLLVDLNHRRGTTVVMVLHDLNLAARYADRLVLMHAGQVVAAGEPADVLNPAAVSAAFGLGCLVTADPVCGAPMVIPIGRHHRAAASSPPDRLFRQELR
jgi:iron complex transport system ATP-binding protein